MGMFALIVVVLILVLALLSRFAGMAMAMSKANQPPWACVIPVYGTYCLVKMVGWGRGGTRERILSILIIACIMAVAICGMMFLSGEWALMLSLMLFVLISIILFLFFFTVILYADIAKTFGAGSDVAVMFMCMGPGWLNLGLTDREYNQKLRSDTYKLNLWLPITLLSFSLVIIFLGTMAQEPMGLNLAVDRFFKGWYVDFVAMEAALRKTVQLFGFNVAPVTPERVLGSPGPPVFPGGYLVGGLLLLNLLISYIPRIEWLPKKFGIYLAHLGIITLLVGQIITDVFQQESFVDMERGDRRNYSVSFDDNEMVFMLPIEGQSNRVISIPEKMLTVGSKITHPELDGLTLEVEKYWVNAKPMTADQLVELDSQNHTDLQKGVVDQVFEVMNSRITAMEEYLRQNPEPEQRSALTRLKGRFFELRGGEVELRALADMLGLVGEMEMSVYGLKEESERLVFNSQAVRNLLVKVRAYEDQRTISNLFTQATKGQLGGCTLRQFENNATDFMVKIKDFPGGASGKIIKNTEQFVKRIKGRAKIYYAGTDQGQLGQFFRFVQPLQPVFSQNDRNLPAALLKVTHEEGKSGKYLFTCSSDFQQTVKLDGGQGDKWKAIFRPKRHYLGFDLTLVDLKWEKYRGTEIPKNFQSRVVIEDESETRSVDIFMNNPLRKGGQTFYQFQMNQNQLGATVQTVLQVVKNPNWITAYIGCVIVTVGLLYQFIYHLVGFARKRRKTTI